MAHIEEVETQLRSFLTVVLDGGEKFTSRPGPFIPVHIHRSLCVQPVAPLHSTPSSETSVTMHQTTHSVTCHTMFNFGCTAVRASSRELGYLAVTNSFVNILSSAL